MRDRKGVAGRAQLPIPACFVAVWERAEMPPSRASVPLSVAPYLSIHAPAADGPTRQTACNSRAARATDSETCVDDSPAWHCSFGTLTISGETGLIGRPESANMARAPFPSRSGREINSIGIARRGSSRGSDWPSFMVPRSGSRHVESSVELEPKTDQAFHGKSDCVAACYRLSHRPSPAPGARVNEL